MPCEHWIKTRGCPSLEWQAQCCDPYQLKFAGKVGGFGQCSFLSKAYFSHLWRSLWYKIVFLSFTPQLFTGLSPEWVKNKGKVWSSQTPLSSKKIQEPYSIYSGILATLLLRKINKCHFSFLSSHMSFNFPHKTIFIPIYHGLCSGIFVERHSYPGAWVCGPNQCETSENMSLKHGSQEQKNLEQVHPQKTSEKTSIKNWIIMHVWNFNQPPCD